MPTMTDDGAKELPPAEPPPREVRSSAVSRIAIALIATWTALVAIPGAVPWAATDDAARALAIGIGISSIIAIVGLALAFVRDDSLGNDGAKFGAAAALIGVALAGLAVVNLMLIPDDARYRETATGIGLLVLLAVVMLAAVGSRTGVFEGFRFSSLTLVGTVVGLALIGVYLFVVQGLFGRTGPATLDPEWVRLTALLAGLQSLAFAAAGAVLGTTVQGQVTGKVTADLTKADTSLAVLDDTVQDVKQKLDQGLVVPITHPGGIDGLIADTLAEETGNLSVAKRIQRVAEVRQKYVSSEGLAAQLRQAQDHARRIRRS